MCNMFYYSIGLVSPRCFSCSWFTWLLIFSLINVSMRVFEWVYVLKKTHTLLICWDHIKISHDFRENLSLLEFLLFKIMVGLSICSFSFLCVSFSCILECFYTVLIQFLLNLFLEFCKLDPFFCEILFYFHMWQFLIFTYYVPWCLTFLLFVIVLKLFSNISH